MTNAGHSPDVVEVYGLASLPDITRGRKKVKRLTGESFVPVLVLDDGMVIRDSKAHRGLRAGECPMSSSVAQELLAACR
jgi:hypothetical protein